nr:unnamed protein product [Callosobruchus chinensis]
MASRRKRRSRAESAGGASADLEALVRNLSISVTELKNTVGQLADTVATSQLGENDKDNLNSGRPPVPESGAERVIETKSREVIDRFYIMNWKELGGGNLTFSAYGKIHPMLFLERLDKTFQDAGVPEQAELGLAVGCLRGSAAEWGSIKEDTLIDFNSFKQAFKDRFWSIEKQRELYMNLVYGAYRNGSRADYFLDFTGEVFR